MSANHEPLPAGIRLQDSGNIRLIWWRKGRAFSKTVDLPHTEDGIARAVEMRHEMMQCTGAAPSSESGPRDLTEAYIGTFDRAKRRASKVGREYTISVKERDRLVIEAGGRCSLTGIAFSLDRHGGSKSPFAPSLDRVDSTEGYHYWNCRLVCVAANMAMNQWGEAVLRELAKGYVAYTMFSVPPRPKGLKKGHETDRVAG